MKKQHLGITIDTSRDKQLEDYAVDLLKQYYMLPHEVSPQEAFARASTAYCFGDYELAQRLYDAVSQGWFMFASPVLSNAPEIDWNTVNDFEKAKKFLQGWLPGKKLRGLPISCFLNYVGDNLESLIGHTTETRWLSVKGGGVGSHWSAVRSQAAKIGKNNELGSAPGIVPFLHTMNADVLAYNQGSTRRGSYAAYLDVSHPEIEEFLEMRVPTGDINRKNLNMHHGVNITDKFLQAVKNDEEWELIDPKAGVLDTIKARTLWSKIIKTRLRTGEPYMLQIDEANRKLNKAQRDKGMTIKGSNLCISGWALLSVKKNGHPYKVAIAELYEEMHAEENSGAKWEVLSYNEDSKICQYQRIEKCVMTNKSAKVVKLCNIDKGVCDKDLVLTADHQVAVFPNDDLFWKEAGKIKQTDVLMWNIHGVPVKGSGWYTEEFDREVAVYDLTVSNNHNFFANGILAHNCAEIVEATSEDRTAVCCLSSPNIEKYDEWKGTSLIRDMIRLLDNTLEFFIQAAPKELSRAVFSATAERSLGLGAMGFHTYLMSHNIPFESVSAKLVNKQIFSYIQQEATEESKLLAQERGEPSDLVGTGMRNAHLTAIAPNANSGLILNTSPSIEPQASTAYPHKFRIGTVLMKNKYLDKILQERITNEDKRKKTWRKIIADGGSVQNLPKTVLSDEEKEVFKTAKELDQHWVVDLAADRQEYIDQSQSLNLFFPRMSDLSYVMSVHWRAMNSGVKSLYYLRTEASGATEKVDTQIERKVLNTEECLACAG